MSIISVYSFRYYDHEQDAYLLGNGKCQRDEIVRKGWEVIESTEEKMDSSLLTDTGRYHAPKSNSEP